MIYPLETDDLTYANDWEAYLRFISGNNNGFSLILYADADRDARQVIRVHGHQITPKYRREISTKDANYPPIPFEVTETAE